MRDAYNNKEEKKTIMEMLNIKNYTVVVVGAGLIGREVIIALAQAGASVFFGDINFSYGVELQELCRDKGYDVTYRHLNFSDENDVNVFIEYCLSEHGKIDAWVNSAYPKPENWGKENICSLEFFKECINEHLGGYYVTSAKIAEAMKKQGFGSVINFGSIYGIRAPDFSIYEGTDIKNPILYTMMKGAINNMSMYLASYYGKYGVRFNVISPGGIFDFQDSKFVEKYEKKTPLERMARKEDIIGAILFLVSDASSYVTGQNIIIDGGFTI